MLDDKYVEFDQLLHNICADNTLYKIVEIEKFKYKKPIMHLSIYDDDKVEHIAQKKVSTNADSSKLTLLEHSIEHRKLYCIKTLLDNLTFEEPLQVMCFAISNCLIYMKNQDGYHYNNGYYKMKQYENFILREHIEIIQLLFASQKIYNKMSDHDKLKLVIHAIDVNHTVSPNYALLEKTIIETLLLFNKNYSGGKINVYSQVNYCHTRYDNLVLYFDTPLNCAITKQKKEIVELLINKGAELNGFAKRDQKAIQSLDDNIKKHMLFDIKKQEMLHESIRDWWVSIDKESHTIQINSEFYKGNLDSDFYIYDFDLKYLRNVDKKNLDQHYKKYIHIHYPLISAIDSGNIALINCIMSNTHYKANLNCTIKIGLWYIEGNDHELCVKCSNVFFEIVNRAFYNDNELNILKQLLKTKLVDVTVANISKIVTEKSYNYHSKMKEESLMGCVKGIKFSVAESEFDTIGNIIGRQFDIMELLDEYIEEQNKITDLTLNDVEVDGASEEETCQTIFFISNPIKQEKANAFSEKKNASFHNNIVSDVEVDCVSEERKSSNNI